ncbi:MAG: TlpA family protein disulfide reductase [Gemmatimonadota bacterium]
MGDRSRDLLVTGTFLAIVAALVAMGWLTRDPAVPLADGGPAPSLELPRLTGGTLGLEELRGKVVMVNIWATWCPPCVREMPSMQRVYDAYRDDGLEIVAVAVDHRPGVAGPDGRVEGPVSEFVDRLGLTFPVVLDPTGDTERRFGTEHLPTTVLIDRSGRVRVREVGGRSWDEEPFIGMVESLLGEEG